MRKTIYSKLQVYCLFLLLICVCIYIFGGLYWIITENSFDDSRFADRNKCPACFGGTICRSMLSNQIIPPTLSKFNLYEKSSTRAILKTQNHDVPVVVKSLSGKQAFADLDARICSKSNMAPDCDVSRVLRNNEFVKDRSHFEKIIHDAKSKMFYCPSTRLLDIIISKYKEKHIPDVPSKMYTQMWTTASINAEPLLLQTFPASEGWPFPVYYGACGRYVVIQDCGESLAKFHDAPWKKRVHIALQLLQLAEKLAHNRADFAIYMLGISYDSFTVNDDGEVTLVDLKDNLVVDRLAVRSAKPKHWDDVHEASFVDCSGKSSAACHEFSEIQLCSHVTSDHNYYVICRYILTQHDDVSGKDGSHMNGLLHNIPETANNDWDLEYLLNECVMPQRQRGRLQVVHKLIEALTHLHVQ